MCSMRIAIVQNSYNFEDFSLREREFESHYPMGQFV